MLNSRQVPGAWRMSYRKDSSHPDGLKMSSMDLFANALPIVAGAVKKGMIPQEALLQ
jgi:hypothetical protein